MPRIRTIKPEYWSDEKLAPLDALTRLVFLGLISQADDAGRMVDSIKMLDGALFPETDDTCGPALEKLAACGRILRYVSGSGQRLIQITNWERHQRVDHASKHVLPAPPREDAPDGRGPPGGEPSRDSREALAQVSRDPRASILDLGPGIMDPGEGGREGAREHAREAAGVEGVDNSGAPDDQDTHPPGVSATHFAVRKRDIRAGLDALWAAGVPQVALEDERRPLRELMREHGPALVLAAIPGLPKHPWVQRRGLFSAATLRMPGMLAECAQLAQAPEAGAGGGGSSVELPLSPPLREWAKALAPELRDAAARDPALRAWAETTRERIDTSRREDPGWSRMEAATRGAWLDLFVLNAYGQAKAGRPPPEPLPKVS